MNGLDGDPKGLTLGHLLAHVSRLVGRRRRSKLQRFGLHHAQGMILFRLWREDGIAQQVFARDLHISPPTASSTLKRMERDGWVERKRDEHDQRVVRVYTTEKSRMLQQELHASFRELDHELASILTDVERENFRVSLIKVHEYLLQMFRSDGWDIESSPADSGGQGSR